jgi:hypothetical protein
MYYASAETLLLRSIGIPARMAVGFVEGNYDEASRKYNVAYKDSHAWTEVYFPGIGWVEFEPTSNQFPLERPETRTNPDEIISDLESKENLAVNPLPPVPLEDQPKPLSDDETGVSSAVQARWYQNFISPALILLALGLGIFMLHRYSLIERLPVYLSYQYERRGNTSPLWLNRWVRWTTLSPIERAFQSINLSLFWLGQPQANHVTSQERAVVLIKRMPEAEGQTLSLLKEYHNTIYTPHSGNPATARNAAVKILLKTWQTLIKETLQIVDSRYNQLK